MTNNIKTIEDWLKNLSEIEDEHIYLEVNDNRKDNVALFNKYVFSESDAKEIVKNLTVDDFCKAVQNKKTGYEYETLYIFGKELDLFKRIEEESEEEPEKVSLYIKINLIEGKCAIIISFHEQKYPLKYAFR